MRIRLQNLQVTTRRTVEIVSFAERVTFIHGPVSTGKSTVARLVDFCFGGDMEFTPAVRQEFVAVKLKAQLGSYDCSFERSGEDTGHVRVNWLGPEEEVGSVNAPLQAGEEPILDDAIYNLSDLIFQFCDTTPMKVRRSLRDPDSPTIRLGFRDLWRFCYLDQAHLDSSFFRFDDPFRRRKTQDALRFFTGLHSEQLSELESELYRLLDDQRGKREAVRQIRTFMQQFGLESLAEIDEQIAGIRAKIAETKRQIATLEEDHHSSTHPADDLRRSLRKLSEDIEEYTEAEADLATSLAEQEALQAELITTKVKAERSSQATLVLSDVYYNHCPQCGADVSSRTASPDPCSLCGTPRQELEGPTPAETETVRLDLNERIDQLGESIKRRRLERERIKRRLRKLREDKQDLDSKLNDQIERYDAGYIESMREQERDLASLIEQERSYARLQEMPRAVAKLEEEAGTLQGSIDRQRTLIDEERSRLRAADSHVAAVALEFKRIMLAVNFPGVEVSDEVRIDPRNWRPTVAHGDQDWSFWDTGSGGKKTLFNVCFALAVHSVASQEGLPVPTTLIIDSPTKNISEDENPELVKNLYQEIYRLADREDTLSVQFVLIDSEIVLPPSDFVGFAERRMAGEPDAPSLISYYNGP